ncbi:MAG: sodium:proton antiporter [Scytolyngbya sp. HA4215-MV1]|nr:sodium:proton antiporter [Scytolyngbya sp. HA4215-MV1]
MDIYILKLLVVGLLLLTVTVGSRIIARLPLSYALIYLIVGVLLGPYGVNLIQLQLSNEWLERLFEMVVIVSLFSCGIKMNRRLNIWSWQSTARLIGILMPISIFAIALIGHWLFNWNYGIAILIGAILAPTDPVLASEVQITHPNDKNELRFGLTSEGGLNDALAFPFVYFGLHWIQDNQWQHWIINWFSIDVIWAIPTGIVGGILVTQGIHWLELRFRQTHGVEEEMDHLIALAKILLAYSFTEMINGYGFLAVFVAGFSVRAEPKLQPETRISQLRFTEQVEKLLEVGTILLLGSLLRIEPILKYAEAAFIIAGLLFFAIRPIGAWLSTTGDRLNPATRLLFGWFGIRGIGSLYYLAYVLKEDIPESNKALISWVTLIIVTISIILHGVTTTPIMKWYENYLNKKYQSLKLSD